MADDEPAAAAASHSSSSPADEEDDEGTDSDGSNPDHAAAPHHPPPHAPDSSAPPHPPEPTGAIPPPPPPPPGAGAEDSRRLFQRLWTDEEELLILRGFLDFTTRRGTTFASHQYDTGPFYDEIQRRLSFDFTKNQLIEKLRRLKKKYRLCAARMASHAGGFAFRSAHEGAIYDLARHIWPPALKRDGTASDEDDINPAAGAAATATAAVTTPGAMEDGFGGSAPAPASTPTQTPRGRVRRRVRRRMAQEQEATALPSTPTLTSTDGAHQEPLVAAMEDSFPQIAQLPSVSETAPMPVTANGANEEAVRSILSPLLKEFISSFAVAGQNGPGMGLNMGFGGAGLNADIAGLGFGIGGLNTGVPSVDKWRQQQILELEVYLKRIELVREQVTAALEELRSSEG